MSAGLESAFELSDYVAVKGSVIQKAFNFADRVFGVNGFGFLILRFQWH